jgi:hypothetical protein
MIDEDGEDWVAVVRTGTAPCPACRVPDEVDPLQQDEGTWYVRCLRCGYGFRIAEAPQARADRRRQGPDRRMVARSGRRLTDLLDVLNCRHCGSQAVRGWVRTSEALWARCRTCGRVERVPDPVLDAEAHHDRVSSVRQVPDRVAFLPLASRTLGISPDRRRGSRRPVVERLEIAIGDESAALVDLSYEGFCITMQGRELPSSFDVKIPTGQSLRAVAKWTCRPLVPVGSMRCGAALSEVDPIVERAWRKFVDALPVS